VIFDAKIYFMKKTTPSKPPKKKLAPKKAAGVAAYVRAQKPSDAAICRRFRSEIAAALPKAVAKIYHSAPVWFIGENAVVDFSITAKTGVRLLFWNGRNLGEPGLKAAGKFNAAQVQFHDAKEIDSATLRRWLRKAGKNIWDFAGLRKAV
jgi:hypothetical protein